VWQLSGDNKLDDSGDLVYAIAVKCGCRRVDETIRKPGAEYVNSPIQIHKEVELERHCMKASKENMP
jgi:hypothetical protein